jgi:ankyrin repeat protein
LIETINTGSDEDISAALNQEVHNGKTLLSLAVEKRDYSLVKTLIDAGVDVNTIEKSNKPLLKWAITNDHPDSAGKSRDIVNALIEKKIDINTADQFGQTLLLAAAKRGNLVVVDLLISAGAAVDTANNYSETPLYWAVRREHTNVVEKLLAVGAAVNQEMLSLETTPEIETRLQKVLEQASTGSGGDGPATDGKDSECKKGPGFGL